MHIEEAHMSFIMSANAQYMRVVARSIGILIWCDLENESNAKASSADPARLPSGYSMFSLSIIHGTRNKLSVLISIHFANIDKLENLHVA
jgi:hypothetical protein